MEAAIITTNNTELVAGSGARISEVIAAFIAQEDCKPSSRNTYRKGVEQFFGWVEASGRTITALSRVDILAFKEYLISEDGANKSTLTAASYLTAVKLFYKWAEGAKLYPNIADGVKLPKRHKRFEKEPLTARQAQALVEEVADGNNLRDAAIINLQLRCGLRCIEVVNANIGDLQQAAGRTILYIKGKGRDSKDDFVIISDKCAAALRAYLDTRKGAALTEPLFVCNGNRNEGGRLTTRSVSRIAKRHLQAIGLDSRAYTAHSLRHTTACVMLQNAGVSYEMVQKTLRHANPATTQAYTYHIDKQRRLEAAAESKLDSIF